MKSPIPYEGVIGQLGSLAKLSKGVCRWIRASQDLALTPLNSDGREIQVTTTHPFHIMLLSDIITNFLVFSSLKIPLSFDAL